jgi:hypothetical protein
VASLQCFSDWWGFLFTNEKSVFMNFIFKPLEMQLRDGNCNVRGYAYNLQDFSKEFNLHQKMKNERTIMIAIAVYAAAMVMIFNMLGAHAQNAQSVKNANTMNEKTSDSDVVNEDVACFLVRSADTKMMNVQEAQKSYGIRRSGGMGGEKSSHNPVALEKVQEIKLQQNKLVSLEDLITFN